jgi:Family of unknown function (DUF6011)
METTAPPFTNAASEKQYAYISALMAEHRIDLDVRAKLAKQITDRAMTKGEASLTINWLRGLPKLSGVSVVEAAPILPVAPVALECGVYVMPDDTIVKLREHKNKTGTYTERWASFSGTRLTLAGKTVKGKWFYAGAYKSALAPEYRMTVAQASEFMLVFGQCARCSRKLKAAQSVKDGLGPVCVKYFAI